MLLVVAIQFEAGSTNHRRSKVDAAVATTFLLFDLNLS